MQLPTNLSGIHGLHLQRHDCRRVVDHLHGQHPCICGNPEGMSKGTKQVLDRMKEEDLHLKLTKCAFNQMEVEYLGLVVRNGEVLMDPTKLKAVEQWEPPKLVKVVRSFIGFCNFY